MLKKIIINASYNTIGKLIVSILSFIVVPFYLYKLTIPIYGIYAFIQAFFSYFSLFQVGVGPAVTKYVSSFYASRNYDRINHIITCSFIIQFVASLIIALIIVCSGKIILSGILNIDGLKLTNSRVALNIACLNFVFEFPTQVLLCALQGFQRYDTLAKILVLKGILTPVSAICFLAAGYGISGMFAGYTIVNMVVMLGILYVLKNQFKWFSLTLDFPVRKTLKLLYNFGFYVFIGRLSRLGATALPVFFIGNLLGSSFVGYYQICLKILQSFHQIPVNIMTVLFPLTSELSEKKGPGSVKKLYLEANKYGSLMITPVISFICFFSYPILLAWLGQKVASEAWATLSLLAGGFLLANITVVPVNVIMGLGNTKPLAVNGIARIVTVIIFLPFFLRVFGFPGTGINFILLETVSLSWLIYVNRKIIKLKNEGFRFWVSDRLFHILLTIPVLSLLLFLNKALFCLISNDRIYTTLALIFCFFIFGYVFLQSIIFLKIIEKEYQEKLFNLFDRLKLSWMFFMR